MAKLRERVGDVPTEMFRHFFHSLCCAARCNLQIAAKGDNYHHKAEAIFKALWCSLSPRAATWRLQRAAQANE